MWDWIIFTQTMIGLIKKYSFEIATDPDLKYISDYLSATGIMNGKVLIKNPVEYVTEALANELVQNEFNSNKVSWTLIKTKQKLYSPGHHKSLSLLSRFLLKKNKPALVLIDSIEIYNFRDHISNSVITGLIESIRLIFQNRDRYKILAKAAFPSEIYPYLDNINQEKVEGKNLFILWRFKDLVCLIAKRHYEHLNPDEEVELKALESYNKAREYLYQYYPEYVITAHNIKFDTLAYIIRHTLKKPRQIILLMNIILTISENEKKDFEEFDSDFIRKCVHARLDILIKGTLNMFEKIYPDAERIVRRTLCKAPCIFDTPYLDVLIKQVSSLRAKSDLSAEDVKRLLLECGFVGIINAEHCFKDSDVCLEEVLFEYQIKGILTLSNNSKCAVHPMIYQNMLIRFDLKQFIYPMPYENEEIDVLASSGITLA
jgi:hypothetical protein